MKFDSSFFLSKQIQTQPVMTLEIKRSIIQVVDIFFFLISGLVLADCRAIVVVSRLLYSNLFGAVSFIVLLVIVFFCHLLEK